MISLRSISLSSTQRAMRGTDAGYRVPAGFPNVTRTTPEIIFPAPRARALPRISFSRSAGTAAPRSQPSRAHVGQKIGQQADRRQESAQAIDEGQAGVIREQAERGRADPAEPERQAEEQARDRSDIAGRQFLRVDDHRRERRRQDQSDCDAVDDRADETKMRQQQGERQHAEDRDPDYVLAPDAVADRAARESARRDRAEEDEQQDLRLLQ